MSHACSEHVVLFYDADTKIEEAAARFLYRGMSQGEDAVVIATPERRAALVPWLVSLGLEGFQKNPPRLLMYDAVDTLSSFMNQGTPDGDLFRSAMMPMFSQTRRGPWAFGEMVDILARKQQFDAVLCLEELWSREIAARGFPLFCAYSLQSFAGPNRAVFDEICRRHSRVLIQEKPKMPASH